MMRLTTRSLWFILVCALFSSLPQWSQEPIRTFPDQLSPRSRWVTYWKSPNQQLADSLLEAFLYASTKLDKAIQENLPNINSPSFDINLLTTISLLNQELSKLNYPLSISLPSDNMVPVIYLESKIGKPILIPYFTFDFEGKKRDVLFNVNPEELSQGSLKKIGIKKRNLPWLKVPGAKGIWITQLSKDVKTSSGKSNISELETLKLTQRGNVTRFVRTLQSETTQKRERKVILALDTDIGNMQLYATQLLAELNRRSKQGIFGNIIFVRGRGNKLQSEISGKIQELKNRKKIQSSDDVDIILIANNKNTLEGKYDNIKERLHTYLINIDDTNLTPGTYLPIIELLTFALEVVFTKDFERISQLYKQLTNEELTEELYMKIKQQIAEKKLSLTLILPPIIRINIEELKEIYEVSAVLLQSA